ncbi:MAG: hypothetical protein HC908_07670 [Calothrix sp. SM1_7_51]|nr:hypothetical protein [Calothrix sp. SM1_7_51]
MIIENKNGRLYIQWKSEPHLQKNFQLYKSRHGQLMSLLNNQDNTRKLVQFWIDMTLCESSLKEKWEPENRIQRALEHLMCYSEEICYWAATKLWKEDSYQSWEEYFFLARCLVYDVKAFQRIVVKYQSEKSSLDTFLTDILIKYIKDEAVIAKFSKWRLLCKKSDKELREALQRYGEYEPEISRIILLVNISNKFTIIIKYRIMQQE